MTDGRIVQASEVKMGKRQAAATDRQTRTDERTQDTAKEIETAVKSGEGGFTKISPPTRCQRKIVR